MKKNIPEIAVIGGGASGLAAAVTALRALKENRKAGKVTVYESLQRCGKKILATGNGRCNLSNEFAENTPYFGDGEFAKKVIALVPPKEIKNFFLSLGLLCRTEEEGRIYPMSAQASAVLDSLRFEAERLGAEFITETKITGLKKRGGKFLLNDIYEADCVILAAGGKSAPKQGSDGSGYPLAGSLGHTVTKIYPALVPLTAKGDFFRSLKGIRAKGEIYLEENGRIYGKEKGEIQFTDFGVSGIAVMQLSGTAAFLTSKGKKPILHIDLTPEINKKELIKFISETACLGCTKENLLSGTVPKRLGQIIMKKASSGVLTDSAENMSFNEIRKAAELLKDFPIEITGTRGFEASQVTSGGIPCKEFEFSTMESKFAENFFAAGEILNVDGLCGGFNLQWAWASGITAGKNAAERIMKL